MKYNFTETIDRAGTNAQNVEGFREYMFSGYSKPFETQDDNLIRMWIADMEFATPPEIIEAIKKRVNKRIFGYTLPFEDEYYNSFINWTKDHYQWSFKKESVRTSPGIIPAIYELIQHLSDEGDTILLFTPAYSKFRKSIIHNKRQMVCSDLINTKGYYSLDFDDIEHKIKTLDIKVCILCNPHNPTGRVWSESELRQLGDICLQYGVYIISDDVHCDILRQGIHHIPIAKLFPDTHLIITCMSPSKAFNLAGLLLANIVIEDDLIRKKWDQTHYIRENPLSIAAVQAAYQHGGPWLKELNMYLDENFRIVEQYMKRDLSHAVFHVSESTFLAWVDVSYYSKDVKDLPLYLADRAGVLIEGDGIFISNSKGYIRINVACPKSVLHKGLTRLTHALKELVEA